MQVLFCFAKCFANLTRRKIAGSGDLACRTFAFLYIFWCLFRDICGIYMLGTKNTLQMSTLYTCSISGEPAEVPVVSPVSGRIFEKRLIVKYINENGTDPFSNEKLTVEQVAHFPFYYVFLYIFRRVVVFSNKAEKILKIF